MALIRDGLVVASLAAADYRHESRLSLCLIAALAAVLAPLLVLFGLRYGIVSSLRDELKRNPTTLQLHPLTQGRYGQSFFRALSSRAEARFVLPNTRFLAATMALRNPGSASLPSVDAEMIPTATGDPLLEGTAIDGALAPREAVLSQLAAEKLEVGAGDVIAARLSRIIEDRREAVELPLRIRAVISVSRYPRDAIFVSPDVLLMAEDYREGFAVPEWQATGKNRPTGERLFASFRLFARTIDQVGPLRDWLAANGVDTETRLSEIILVQRLDRSLTLLFLIIAGLGGFGFCLSLTISLWGNVERKRYELAVLRLLGLPSLTLALFPVVQAVFTAVTGCLVAGILYSVTAPVINRLFAEGLTASEVVCRLPLSAFLVAALLTLALATAAAAAAGWRATTFSPADGLRHE